MPSAPGLGAAGLRAGKAGLLSAVPREGELGERWSCGLLPGPWAEGPGLGVVEHHRLVLSGSPVACGQDCNCWCGPAWGGCAVLPRVWALPAPEPASGFAPARVAGRVTEPSRERQPTEPHVLPRMGEASAGFRDPGA